MQAPELIDFHSHHLAPRHELRRPRTGRPAFLALWDEIGNHLGSVGSALHHIDNGDITARVLSTPPALLWPEDRPAPADGIRQINDELAAVVAAHPGALHGLVTVDAFTGEAAAREVHRGIRELGLRGVFVEAARGESLLDAPEARPALAAAAELGVPVFVHPLNPEGLSRQLERYGRLGVRLARGTVNAASLIALLEGGVLDELPHLQVVITTLGIGGLLLAGGFDDGQRLRQDTPDALRRHVYIDTMGFHPALLRAAVDLVGADHVLAGSDWPVAGHRPIRPALESAFEAAGLGAEDRVKIASGNARRLLRLD